MKSYPTDYLKYWRVIRFYMKSKHGLSQADLDIILFLYSEKYFGRDKFDEYTKLLGWDVVRFFRLQQEGWIVKFRNQVGKRKALYKLTIKSERMIQSIYRKLSGEEIPTSLSQNKMFLKNASYLDKAYRDMIIQMNEVIRQQRHLSQ